MPTPSRGFIFSSIPGAYVAQAVSLYQAIGD